jgi:hypothetical protein
MYFAFPFRFHYNAPNLDDAVLCECIAKVLDGRWEQFVSLTLRMPVVELGELSIIIANTISRGLQQSPTFVIVFKHIGMDGVLFYRISGTGRHKKYCTHTK